jgi:hypothetical protein
LDVFQVLQHAHLVLASIAFIQRFQSPARKYAAFITEFGIVQSEVIAIFDRAVRTRNSLDGFIFAATGAFILFPEISRADTAVHPAGGYELNFNTLHNEFPSLAIDKP